MKEDNWEEFFINFFDRYDIVLTRKEYKNGLTFHFEGNESYVYCDINISRDKIKKLEFGRIINGTRNWIKGIFIDRECAVDFQQTSWDSDISDGNIVNFSNNNTNNVCKFLEIPCKTGWKEEEYKVNLKTFYKVRVIVDSVIINKAWNITLYGMAEQDLPLPFDRIGHKILNFYYDSFIYYKRRYIGRIEIAPMKLKKFI